jgi:hypothetical protein
MDEISNALRSLKMPGMAHYWTTMQETRQHDSLSLKDGLQLLIQAEQDSRTTSRNSRLVKKARFRYQASISEVIYDGKRKKSGKSTKKKASKLKSRLVLKPVQLLNLFGIMSS